MKMELYTFWSTLAILILCYVSEAEGAEDSLLDTNQPWAMSVIVVVAAVIGVIAVVALCAGQTKVNPNVRQPGPPDWTRSLVFMRELGEGFNAVSDGMKNLSPFHVMRERLGATVTDAARWSMGMTEGKHVFEVYWPAHKNRGFSSCIGLGSADVPLKKQGRVSLVGDHSQSWGLDLAKRRAIHFTKVQQRLYLGVPDRFFMYVDMDAGKVGFGADVGAMGSATEFYGYILHGIPKNAAKPMYVMVSCCVPNERVQVYYRGTHTPFGGYDLVASASPLQPSQPGAYPAPAPAPAPLQGGQAVIAIYHITTENHSHSYSGGTGYQHKQNSPRPPSYKSSSDDTESETESEKPRKKKGAEKF